MNKEEIKRQEERIKQSKELIIKIEKLKKDILSIENCERIAFGKSNCDKKDPFGIFDFMFTDCDVCITKNHSPIFEEIKIIMIDYANSILKTFEEQLNRI